MPVSENNFDFFPAPLPALQESVEATVPSSSSQSHNGESDFKLLIVDDEQVSRLRLKHLLQKSGYSVLTATNGREAIEIIRREEVDLVLMDIVMPVLDGIKAVRLIRQLLDRSELPIIMMTASEDRNQVLEAFKIGANDYIPKPLDNEILEARVNGLLLIKKAQKELRESEERYALASQGTNDGIWVWNLLTGHVYLSPRWLEMTGMKQQNIPDQDWMQLIHHEDYGRVTALLETHLCGKSEKFETELRMRGQDGNYKWMLCRGLAVHNEAGVPARIAGSLTDITVGKVADPLTGLPNRVLFHDRVSRAVEQLEHSFGQRFAVIYMDVDDFKLINDHLGHHVGDEFLIVVANRIESAIRKADSFVARLGGDEFAVVVEGIDSVADAICVAQRIDREISLPFRVGSREILTRVSMGIAIASNGLQGEPPTVESLLSQSDVAMYHAKKQISQAYCVYEPSMLEESTMVLEMGHDLKLASKRNELHAFYQPIICMESGRTVGFEALLRWHRGVHGIVGPDVFIPIAEANGLIVEIGEWILRESCRQVQQWNREFGTRLMITVNVSIRQIAKRGFLAVIEKALQDADMPPELLRLEVTETVLMQNTDETIELLNAIQAKGVKIAIDDFGTGFSSLSYLHKMPIDVLKIDRSFVMKMAESEKHLAIVRTITTLAASLNLEVVAEGIETADQLAALKALGCQMGQGFLFSTPEPNEKAKQLVQQNWQHYGKVGPQSVTPTSTPRLR